jgi:hypothetical protein
MRDTFLVCIVFYRCSWVRDLFCLSLCRSHVAKLAAVKLINITKIHLVLYTCYAVGKFGKTDPCLYQKSRFCKFVVGFFGKFKTSCIIKS